MKIGVIALAAYKVVDKSGKSVDFDGTDRQLLYAIALDQLIKVKPENVSVVCTDVTVKGVDELFHPLRELVDSEKIEDLVLVSNNELGSKNKGAGEYVMCQTVLERKKDWLQSLDWVVYFTSRHSLFDPTIFDYLNLNDDIDALVSNPDYLLPSGESLTPAPGLYNDMMFAMKPDWFKRYIASMSPEKLVEKKMSSEQNLYNFVQESGLRYKTALRWGLVRFDYEAMEMQIV
jgi:hypothetical protein